MGRLSVWARRRARKKKAKEEAKLSNPEAQDSSQAVPSGATVDSFESYYRAQRILPEEEWPQLLKVLRRPLPQCIRITESPRAGKLLDHLQSVHAAKLLSWAGSAVQLSMGKEAVRKQAELQSWIHQHAECGDITRQEAVSMVPALLLEARGDERLLDMCAAPGSKTGQLLEVVARQGGPSQGLVVANELDLKRAQMLVHQCRRLQTAPLMVTCHKAQQFPKELDGHFHRVLADVPCSGDGTLRKNKRIWDTWTPKNAVSLHSVQLQILRRALRLCRAGGRVVYSTCSLNPLENEAVVAQVLREERQKVILADTSSLLPGLERRTGLNRWAVPKGDKLIWQQSHGESGSMFAPSKKEAQWMCLEKCLRIYPHLQDTGGFFVAVLQRVDEPPETDELTALDTSVLRKEPPRNAHVWYAPFEQQASWQAVQKRYGLPRSFGALQLLVRNDSPKVIYYVTKSLGTLLLADPQRALRHANNGLGVPALQADSRGEYHITQAATQALLPILNKRVLVRCGVEDLQLVLGALCDNRLLERSALSATLQKRLEDVGLGGAALVPSKESGVDAVAIVVKKEKIRLMATELELVSLRQQLDLPLSGRGASSESASRPERKKEQHIKTKKKGKKVKERDTQGGTVSKEDKKTSGGHAPLSKLLASAAAAILGRDCVDASSASTPEADAAGRKKETKEEKGKTNTGKKRKQGRREEKHNDGIHQPLRKKNKTLK
eukprot:TRINITY_DN23631_c0_g1_i1.p1 TRINITY_DN23631_c0_g1~~TRINITY_DN23631_c0_g1_i1.p1  ORF type:complete len:723 (+),score=166.48 TRINITY_DN23631_c0_g1_i1:146-2314(+)